MIMTWLRAVLKGMNFRGQAFLQVPVVSAVSCENLRFPSALFSRQR